MSQDVFAQPWRGGGRGDLPDAEGGVAGGGNEGVVRRQPAHPAHVVLVPAQRPQAVVAAGEVPELDAHVGGARGEGRAGGVEGGVVDRRRVPLERALERARLAVPDLERAVLRRRHEQRVHLRRAADSYLIPRRHHELWSSDRLGIPAENAAEVTG